MFRVALVMVLLASFAVGGCASTYYRYELTGDDAKRALEGAASGTPAAVTASKLGENDTSEPVQLRLQSTDAVTVVWREGTPREIDTDDEEWGRLEEFVELGPHIDHIEYLEKDSEGLISGGIALGVLGLATGGAIALFTEDWVHAIPVAGPLIWSVQFAASCDAGECVIYTPVALLIGLSAAGAVVGGTWMAIQGAIDLGPDREVGESPDITYTITPSVGLWNGITLRAQF